MQIILMVILFNIFIVLSCVLIVGIHKGTQVVRSKSNEKKIKERHRAFTRQAIIDSILTILFTTALCMLARSVELF